jgi:hypothetical protein
MIDLKRFVPRGSHLTVTDGETINDRGEIAASGMLVNGDFRAVVLIPCNGGRPGRHRHCSPAGCPPGRPLSW